MQTYFALLTTLLMVLACAGVLIARIFIFNEYPTLSSLLFIPAALLVFIFSLIIGYFLAQPLHVLDKTIRSFLDGNKKTAFLSKGQLYEADLLSDDFEALVEVTKSGQESLALRERRQTAFMSDVAHELRTPLTAIHGNAEMLLDPDLPSELHSKFCNIIISESERLGRLSNDLLTLQHLDEMAMPAALQRVNLSILVRNVLDMLSPVLRDRKAHVELTGEAPDVLGDPDKLKQLVSNIVENASRFIEPDGHIYVELFGLEGKSLITIRDDGPGFGDADPKLLFDRFYRTDYSRSRETGGSGLGLAIVKSIAEAHDGSVEAVNLPEGGACFIVALPSILGS